MFHALYKYSKTREKRADDEREIEEERKKTERQRRGDEEGSEMMGTAERGEEEIYQETRMIFNDPCMWRGKTTPARSPPPNTDPLT